MDDVLLTRQEGRTCFLVLNRPAALNALDRTLLSALAREVEAIARRGDLSLVVFRGAGPGFCAGADLKEIAGENIAPAVFADHLREVHKLMAAIESLPVPTLAAVHGVCCGGGLELALCCDLIVADAQARIGDAHANYGILPGGGASVRLPRRIGLPRAKELMFSGRLRDAAWCERAGLVNEVAEAGTLDHCVRRHADSLAAKSPLGLRRMKQLLVSGMGGAGSATFAEEVALAELHSHARDFREGLAAFAERRVPAFTGA